MMDRERKMRLMQLIRGAFPGVVLVPNDTGASSNVMVYPRVRLEMGVDYARIDVFAGEHQWWTAITVNADLDETAVGMLRERMLDAHRRLGVLLGVADG